MSYMAAFSDVDLLGWSQQYIERMGLVAIPIFLPSAVSGKVVLSECKLDFWDGDERRFFGYL